MFSFGPSFGNIIKEYQLYSLLKDKDHVFLLLGGNLGNVSVTFKHVIKEMSNFARVVKKSSIYATEAWGMENTPEFLNQVLLVTTDLQPIRLLEKINAIEEKLGRKEQNKAQEVYQSRPIDIDILLWGNLVMETEKLTIPHPRMHQRNFTMVPLAEIAPDFKHPVLNRSIAEVLKNTTDNLKVRKV